MKNNKGFIAISLIYSFFLVFLMTLLAIVANYTHNRILLNDVKKTTQKKLNDLSEFNPISLENKTYKTKDIVTYAGDSWEVISDNENNVTLILSRSLTKTELTSSISSKYHSAIKENAMNMCFSSYDSNYCCYAGSEIGKYNLYYWDDSLVKNVIDIWLLNNALLQKAIVRGTLVEMSFSDGRQNYSSYIRIPVNNEYSNENIWTLTYAGESSKQSLVYVNNSGVVAHTTQKEIKPIIQVKKATT